MPPSHIKGDNLPRRVYTGIRPPCRDNANIPPTYFPQRCLDRCLDGWIGRGLSLESLVSGAVIGKQRAVTGLQLSIAQSSTS